MLRVHKHEHCQNTAKTGGSRNYQTLKWIDKIKKQALSNSELNIIENIKKLRRCPRELLSQK